MFFKIKYKLYKKIKNLLKWSNNVTLKKDNIFFH